MAVLRSVSTRRVRPLTEGWQLAVATPGEADPPRDGWLAAPVPGTAAQALRDAGTWSLERPEPLHSKDIWYRTSFDGTGRQFLRFEGLATVAEVFLNGVAILRSENMHLAHEVEIDLAGSNQLVIVFRSLDRYLETTKGRRARWRTRLVENNALRLVRTTLLGQMTGWMPAVHAVGPWRAIELIEQGPGIAVRHARIRTRLEDADGLLSVKLTIDPADREDDGVVVIGETTVPLTWTADGTAAAEVRLPNVRKWWPHTHGEPALYTVSARLGDTEIDLGRIGFRSISIDRGHDGRGFAISVNGVPVFARGACWSAADAVTLAGDRKSLEPWLVQARDANMNMIRVGGTMLYESDAFFELCDEVGLMVWHDFMFANMDYPLETLRQTIESEVNQFLGRTEGHVSLTVLCGGSEVAQQAAMFGLPPASWTGELYEALLPAAVAAGRPDVPYVPHSPGGGDLPFSTDAGVAHYYGVGAYLRPLEDARRADVRFTSECLAFANLPCHATLAALGTDDASLGSGVPRDRGAEWDFGDVRDHYLGTLFGGHAEELRTQAPRRYLRLSRAVSAEAMRETISEWRRSGSSCAGALVWMLKDFVAGAGWGVVDSLGRPKLAWHALRRAFQPIQVCLTDEGLNGLALHLVNDGPTPVQARLSLVCLLRGEVPVLKREREVTLPPHSARAVSSAELVGSFFDITCAYHFGPPALDCTAVRLADAADGRLLGDAIHYPQGRAALAHSAGIQAELVEGADGWRLRLATQRLAPCVQVEDVAFRAEDEGFFMLPGEERSVRLLPVDDSGRRPAGLVVPGYRDEQVAYGDATG